MALNMNTFALAKLYLRGFKLIYSCVVSEETEAQEVEGSHRQQEYPAPGQAPAPVGPGLTGD